MEMDKYNSLTSTIVKSQGGVVTCMKATANNVFVGLDTGIISIVGIDGKNERILKAGERGVWCLDFWEDEVGEGLLVVGGVDLLAVWILETLEKKVDLMGHASTVRCVKILSATTLISSSRDATLRVWDIETGTCTAVFEGHSLCVRDFAVSGDTVVSVSYDHDGRVWDRQSRKCLHVLKGHEAQVYAVDFDGERIVTGGLDHTARIWDPDSGSCLAVLQVKATLVAQLQLLPSLPSLLIGADNSGAMHTWSLDDYSKVRTMDAHQNSVTSMQCVKSNIVTGGSDGKVKVWDLTTGDLLQDLASSDAVWKVAIANERIIAVFSRNNEVVLEFWAAAASTTK